jgi:hypothetical protein
MANLAAEIFYKTKSDVVSNEYSYTETDEIKKAIISHIPESKHLLCLDLHGVADKFEVTDNISTLPICIISYVGKTSKNRQLATEQITKRLENGKILLGILVFKRHYFPHKVYGINATKAWIISLIKQVYPNILIDFIDDSDDHLYLTNYYAKQNDIHGITTHKVNTKGPLDKLKQIITNIERKQTGGEYDYQKKYHKYKQKYLLIKLNN